MTTEVQEPHICDRGARWPLHDARGIFCCYCCDTCEDEKRSRYRLDVLQDPNYEADEAIEGDG